MANENTSFWNDSFTNSSRDPGDGPNGWPYFSMNGYSYWVVLLIIVIMGIVGNVMVLVLMSNSTLSQISYTVYMRFLAITDTMVLVARLYDQTSQVFELGDFADSTNSTCKIWNYIKYGIAVLSPWLIVGFTVDRCVCIAFPMQRQRFCTRIKAMLTCLSLTFITAAMHVIILISVEVKDGRCQAPLAVYSFYFLTRLVLSSTLPCILIFIPTIIMIIRIQRSAEFRKSFSSTNQQRDKSTRPLMLVSIFAFLTLLPLVISECVEVVLGLTGTDDRAMILTSELWPLFNIIYVFNFGQNFYILMLSSAKYRNIMARIMCDCKKDATTLKKQNTQLAGGKDVVASSSNLVNN